MEKTTTLNLRVNPEVKENAEAVLKMLGLPMSTAIDMFLRQIAMTGGIPFSVTVPMAPPHLNADLLTGEEIRALLDEGYESAKAGNLIDATEVTERMRRKYERVQNSIQQ